MDKQALTRHISFEIFHYSKDANGFTQLDAEQTDTGRMFSTLDGDLLKKQLEEYMPGMVWDGSGGYCSTKGIYITLESVPVMGRYTVVYGYPDGALTDEEQEVLDNAYYPF